MPTRREFTGGAPVATLAADMTTTSTTVQLQAGQGAQYPTGAIGAFAIDVGYVVGGTALSNEEKILCSSRTSDTLVVATGGRGYDGTTAQSHKSGETVIHCLTAIDLDEANAHTTSSAGVHGLVGSVVGTTDAQTMSNKTLVGPAIADYTAAQHSHVTAAGGGRISLAAVTDAATKANDNAVLHLTGDESASGVKTFSSLFKANGAIDASGASAATQLIGTIGDKIGLHSAGYGVGVQAARLVLYVASGAGVAVRQGAASAPYSVGTDAVLLGADGKVTAADVVVTSGAASTVAMTNGKVRIGGGHHNWTADGSGQWQSVVTVDTSGFFAGMSALNIQLTVEAGSSTEPQATIVFGSISIGTTTTFTYRGSGALAGATGTTHYFIYAT